MKIGCGLARFLMAWRLGGERTGWLRAHVEKCEACRREANAFDRLSGSLRSMRECRSESGLAWERLAPMLSNERLAVCSRRLAFAVGAACVLVALAVVAGVVMRAGDSRPPRIVKRIVPRSPVPSERIVKDAPRPAPDVPEMRKPQAEKKLKLVPRRKKRWFAHGREKAPAPISPKPEAPAEQVNVVVVEHVIDVVGVDEKQEDRADYVIGYVDPDEEYGATPL